MVNRELLRRLEEIKQSGVPYRILRGNNLPGNFNPDNVAGRLGEEGLPEVVSSLRVMVMNGFSQDFKMYLSPDPPIDLRKKYGGIFSKALGIDPKQGERYFEDATGANLERHQIYNPQTDETHEFILPSRDLLKVRASGE